MQAIMKAGKKKKDHLGVGVRQPDGQNCRPITNDYLFVEIPGNFNIKGSKSQLIHIYSSRTALVNSSCTQPPPTRANPRPFLSYGWQIPRGRGHLTVKCPVVGKKAEDKGPTIYNE